jgi:hypothetical protein
VIRPSWLPIQVSELMTATVGNPALVATPQLRPSRVVANKVSP